MSTQAGDPRDVVTLSRDELARLRKGADDAARREREHTVKIDALGARNVRLAELLKDSRDQLEALKGEVERLGTPPSTYGVVVDRPLSEGGADPETCEVSTGGRRMRLIIAPGVNPGFLRAGVTVRLNEAMTIVETCSEIPPTGVTALLRDVLADGCRARIVLGNDEEHVVHLAQALRGGRTADRPAPVRPGDAVLVDPKAAIAFEVVPKAEVDELLLEEVPTVGYADIGGLGAQIEQIRDAIELPFLHHDLYREFHLAPPKGVLLYGPPGCGKTLIAKAVAHSLAEASARARGENAPQGSYFLSIKGPELLNKYVGETERHIRSIFERAREKATEGTPVIVFFDEMDSIFRTRGSGVSSDMETTIVPQLLAEIDGVEDLRNVIVIGASNREDMIDPAILRPGRLDLKIRIDRPDRVAAADILGKYVTADLRFDPDEVAVDGTDQHVARLVERIVERLYRRDDSTRYVDLVFASGRRESMYLGDLTSGAMLRNVVDRAKKLAIKDIVHGTGAGLTTDDFLDAVDAEFAENTDLPNTTNPQEWARLSGVRGERVVEVVVPHRREGSADA